jgi:hypothetical protein
VRFRPELHDFVRLMGEDHPEGQSGVINDAVEFYAARHDRAVRQAKKQAESLYKAIVAGSGHGSEEAQDA